jgi:excisionase family DNA binding protein
MPDEFPKSDGSRLDPCLKDWVDRVIVPALVREYLAQSRELETEQRKLSERRNLPSTSAAQPERLPSVSNAKQLLTVAEAATALGIKDATVRAWISKRKITYVKLGRLVRIPAKEIKVLIDSATIPSRA